MTKIFAIFKNEKKSDKAPDYNISVKVGEKHETIGGCWLKEGKSGKFFSCKFSEPYGDRKGYEISESKPETMKPAITPQNYPKDDIRPEDIPF